MFSITIEPYNYSPTQFDQITYLCRDFEFFRYYLEYFQDRYYKVWIAQIQLQDKMIIAGVIVMARHSFNLYGDFLWVDQDFRNQGIGNQLLQFVEKYAIENGYRALIGETPETDVGAQRLYQKNGASLFGSSEPLYADPFKMLMFRKKFPENLDSPKNITE